MVDLLGLEKGWKLEARFMPAILIHYESSAPSGKRREIAGRSSSFSTQIGGSTRRFELLSTHVIAHADIRLARPVIGFLTFAEDELIASDGPLEIRAPCADCTIFMPARGHRRA